MEELHKELQQRLRLLEGRKQSLITQVRITELQQIIIIVQNKLICKTNQ
jgi:hypothetical protein